MNKHDNEHGAMYDLAIVGSGPTGLAGAMYAGRLKMKTIVLGDKRGGTIVLTDEIANYPGFRNITGIEIADRLRGQAMDYGAEIAEKRVASITRCSESCFKLYTGKREHVHARTVLFATGTRWKRLDVPGESEFANKGVHYCALCDGPFFKGKTVAVVGGSDSAAKEALVLAEFAKKVYMIHRGSDIRPEPVNRDRVKANDRIVIIRNTQVKRIQGKSFVESLLLDRPYKGKDELPVSGIFIDIGRVPLSELPRSLGVELNERGEVSINRESETNIPGVYAAGDVSDSDFKQAITGVAEGIRAVFSAYNYINKSSPICICQDPDDEEHLVVQ